MEKVSYASDICILHSHGAWISHCCGAHMLVEDKCINPMQEIIIAGYGGISSIWNFLAFTVLLLVNLIWYLEISLCMFKI